MATKNFKKRLKDHQIDLIGNRERFDKAQGGGMVKGKGYDHILKKGDEKYNLFSKIRDDVHKYFQDNNIFFWGGKTISPNTLSSQVSCLNHLFFIRGEQQIAKAVMQKLVGNIITIKSLDKVIETKYCEYIAFEMVGNEDRMNEGKLTRGNTCTSIDAFAIANDIYGNKHILVIEWKLVEDDSGNQAPTKDDSTNLKLIESGETRMNNYRELIAKSSYIDSKSTALFHLPFYELMRQTLWAENNKVDFGADDYVHIHVVPKDNIMRHKKYKCANNIIGVSEGWKAQLTDEGKKRYVIADPHSVVDALRENKCIELADYLEERYYTL